MTSVLIPDGRGKKDWRKVLTGVDANQGGGFAYVGEWLPRGERVDLPVGAYVLVHNVEQGADPFDEIAQLCIVSGNGDGTGELVPVREADGREISARGRSWGETLKPRLLALVGAAVADPEEIARNVRGKRSRARAAVMGEPAPASSAPANPRQIVSLPRVDADVKLSRDEQFAVLALKELEPDRQAAVLMHAGLLR